MNSKRICAIITDSNINVAKITPMADMFEVRIDLIGNNWEGVAVQLSKPWIACNRSKEEGGNWQGSETDRKKELLKAIQIGATVVDIELTTPGLEEFVPVIKRKSKCLISSHDFNETPSFGSLKEIVLKQLAAGADICKLVTFAKKIGDNLTVLKLIQEFPEHRIVAFAMGDLGLLSRILCPLAGGDFIYAAIEKGAESAPGQMIVTELYEIYRMVNL